ncbi:hypothetical protein CVT25_004420 [Psilocybe cyanescens]|uniref:Cytochrome c oxidase subunit 8, mitochondrial n=1 Tax=Psilocybe cyanescens TaxID=93625 RepID=A0A409XW00_PSICY|nr:hypothetical protein CVT25_004420 [Psilocybe cyanescens]
MSALTTRVILRTAHPLPVSRQLIQRSVFRRYAHGQAEIAESVSQHQEIPFSTDNKKALAAKCLAYMGTGFMIPFIAVYWTLTKNKVKSDD